MSRQIEDNGDPYNPASAAYVGASDEPPEDKPNTPTPLPWAAKEDGTIITLHDDYDEIVCCLVGQAIPAAFFSDVIGRSEANARLIVRAVNAHNDLFTCCKAAMHLCGSLLATRQGATDELVREIYDACRAAITKAKGE